MKRSTACLLIALRLAIGWHFLFEGLHKVDTLLTGPTVTNKPFTSAGYFREGTGWLAQVFRQEIGDPDDQALALLGVLPLAPGQDPAGVPPHQRMPPALDQEWTAYFDRFVSHYRLDDRQKDLARARLDQAKDELVVWLDRGNKEVKRSFPTGAVEIKLTTPQRVEEYRAKLREVRDALQKKNPALGRDVEKQHLVALKGEAARLRGELKADLDEKTAEMKNALDDVLTPRQREEGPPPEPSSPGLQGWLDRVTAWGLTALGACLLLGLLTRTSCVLAAGFLVMTYLSSPPFPWLPVPPQNEGTYVFLNKNAIEALALLVLATTPSGRWLGLDALIHWTATALFGRRQPPLAA